MELTPEQRSTPARPMHSHTTAMPRPAQVHRASSADKIESILRLHVYPALAEQRIATVRPTDIQAWVKRLLVEALAEHLTAFPPVPREMVCRDEAGRTWTEVTELVFTTARGEPLTRSRFGEAWRDAVKEAGLPAGTSYHDLRHFYASLLIDHGESVKVVQRRLGHASATETLDTYSLLWSDSEDRTRDAVDSVLGASRNHVRTKRPRADRFCRSGGWWVGVGR